MSNLHYNWSEIESDCIEMVTMQIAEGKKIPSSVPALHKLLSEKYNAENKVIPKLNTFRQVMHDRLKVSHNQKNISAALYRLAGRYDKMTLAQLTENITLTSGKTAGKSPWIFIRLKGSGVSMTDKASHLYLLSRELKRNLKKISCLFHLTPIPSWFYVQM